MRIALLLKAISPTLSRIAVRNYDPMPPSVIRAAIDEAKSFKASFGKPVAAPVVNGGGARRMSRSPARRAKTS